MHFMHADHDHADYFATEDYCLLVFRCYAGLSTEAWSQV